MAILGISAFYHDSSAALIHQGKILCAAQEERFTRKKFDASFPKHAIDFCLKSQNIHPADLEYIVFYEKPFHKFDRILETFLATAPSGFPLFLKAIPEWLKDKLFQKEMIQRQLRSISPDFGNKKTLGGKILFSEHHLSHAASAFFPSPFKSAAILTMDGVGEWSTTTIAHGQDHQIRFIKEIRFPHSLGLLYSAFTAFLGFKVNSGEYKMMGLAPYGKPKYRRMILNHMINVKEDGSFQLNMDYFNFLSDEKMYNPEKWLYLFGERPRIPEGEVTQEQMDLAASIQRVIEDIVLKIAHHARALTGEENVCLAGGVALNCVANGLLLRENVFKNIWIQPASGDAGGSLGAALAVEHIHLKTPRRVQTHDQMNGSYLGPEPTAMETRRTLEKYSAVFENLSEETLMARTAQSLSRGQAVGWVHGPMEFGPRALGNRSILADPRSATIQRDLNLKIKFRESFRPFAPAVLAEKVEEWFEFRGESPYMLFTVDVKKEKLKSLSEQQLARTGMDLLNTDRSQIPAVTHVDNSARLQTVHQETNPRFHRLLRQFYELTGCPILVNTSFNVRGEPIVSSAEDAYRCFMETDLDILVIGNYFLEKSSQPQWTSTQKTQFDLD
ncbi:MAG: carbamoyltransferase [Bdellovibrionales bacterium]|nr:carbamoyltransferase [Bdellovibrionales bacterium]